MEDCDYRFKYTFTGDSGVGKTTTIFSFLEKHDASILTTLGVEYLTKTITVDKMKILLHIWDTVYSQLGRLGGIQVHCAGLL